MHFQMIFNLIRYVKVVHHVKGRIRFRLLPEALDSVSEMDYHETTSSICSLPGIEDVRINVIAGSIVVYYNPLRIRPSLWERLIHGDELEISRILTEI